MVQTQTRKTAEATTQQRQMIEQFQAFMGRGLPEVARAPEVVIPPAPIEKDRRYVFRSRPGTFARYRLKIPATPPPAPNGNEKYHGYMVAKFQKKYGDQLAVYDALAERVGQEGGYIDFQTVETAIPGTTPPRKTRECVYQTNDPEIAAFIREHIKDESRLYEDVPPLTVTLGGREIVISVTDDAERADVAAALSQQGHALAERLAQSAGVEYAGAGPHIDDLDDLPAVPLDKNGKPLRGVALASWKRKHGLAA